MGGKGEMEKRLFSIKFFFFLFLFFFSLPTGFKLN